MSGYARRLLTATAAYQLGDVVSKFLALATLPLYTRHLSRGDYGISELLLTLVIFTSILVRLGLGEAFVRYWYVDEDAGRRDALARRAIGIVLTGTTALALVLAAFAGPLSKVVLSHRDAVVFLGGVLGLWAFTNLEMAYALLRVEERKRAYATASIANVLLTVAATVILVVVLEKGAAGLVYGNFGASAVIVVVLLCTQRHRLLRRREGAQPNRLRTLLYFGLPTVPADASVYALNLVDRLYLYHHRSPASAGLYSLAVKLAGVVTFAVRGFQYAWPPLAYSVASDQEASRLYATVTTWYVFVTGWVVCGLVLLGRWVVRLLAAPNFFPAHTALPWLGLGWALYGLYVIFIVIAGRAQVTTRNFPAALVGLVTNIVLLFVLVPPLGLAGAGIALAGAYVLVLVVMYLLTRRLFTVAFEWARLALLVSVLAGVSVAGELLLPTHGAVGFLTRAAALACVPALLVLVRFIRPTEVARARALLAAALSRSDDRSGRGSRAAT